jgi:4-carboxymuconolactone decarboxylase
VTSAGPAAKNGRQRGASLADMNRPTAPRVSPLPVTEQTEADKELLRSSILPEANIFTTLVRAPGLFRKWLPFGGKLLSGKLSPRDRELLILRTAWNCKAEYEWGQHVIIGGAAGITAAEIDRITSLSTDSWSAPDAILLNAADELHDDYCISDDTWAKLTERYDVQQLIEIPMLVGQYHLVAMTLNSLGVPLDDGVEGLPK